MLLSSLYPAQSPFVLSTCIHHSLITLFSTSLFFSPPVSIFSSQPRHSLLYLLYIFSLSFLLPSKTPTPVNATISSLWIILGLLNPAGAKLTKPKRSDIRAVLSELWLYKESAFLVLEIGNMCIFKSLGWFYYGGRAENLKLHIYGCQSLLGPHLHSPSPLPLSLTCWLPLSPFTSLK